MQLHGVPSARRTGDLDIAIAIPDWHSFEKVEAGLIADGFVKSKHMRQRFYCDEYEVDVVPYGGVAKDDDKIYWPPDEEIAMNVKGFDTVLSESITVNIDDEFTVKIASLHGLFLLKFNAWLDRNMTTSKDAEDMSYILSNYFFANIDRNIHPEVYDWEDFDEYIVGAYWLACDLFSLLTVEQVDYYRKCIERELEREEESRLINQIIEHCAGLRYDEVRQAWQTIADIFNQNNR